MEMRAMTDNANTDRFLQFVQGVSDLAERWRYPNGEPIAPDAAAFLVEYRAALARAERAEAEVERLRAVIDGAGDDADWLSIVAGQRDELQRRVDELEEAARWRPASEAPAESGEYLALVQTAYRRRIVIAHYWVDRYSPWGEWKGKVLGWQPLPPPPAEATP